MKGKFVSAREAVQAVRPGDRVFIGMGAEPTSLIDALLNDADRVADIQLLGGLSLGDYKFLRQEYVGTFTYSTWQASPRVACKIRAGAGTFLPVTFSLIPSLIAPDGPFPIDVGFVCVSPPDASGYVSFGISAGLSGAVARSAKVLVAEVNARMPRTRGNARIHVSEIDYLIEVDRPLVEAPPRVPSAADRCIGAHVANLIPDGATLEIGLGAIPTAVYGALQDKKELGIHSGMIADGLIDLVESGVVTNTRKTADTGKTVAGEILGTQALFDYVADNPAVEMHPVDYTHDPHVLGRIENFCAVNSAVEVDLTGQVNAESLAGVPIGCGGQLDFTLGALLSPGGRGIIALQSTGKQGTVSRIVSRLGADSPVTVPRMLTQYVVTEHGVADLRYKDFAQRAQALAALAHPDFREDLERRAREEPGPHYAQA